VLNFGSLFFTLLFIFTIDTALGSFHAEDEAPINLTTVMDDAWVQLSKERDEILSSTPQGDLQIDDSLLEDDDDGDVDADADQALKESEAEAIKSGVLREYSKGVLEEIKTQISTRGHPKCYTQGTFWIRPRDPVFALYASTASDTGFSPMELYHLDIFLWLPNHLPDAPSEFNCTCGNNLTLNGWNDNPVARRVKSVHRDYLLLTNRWVCRKASNGCGTSYQGTDPHVLSQLPRHLQESFPALLTARAAVDKGLMSLMRTCFATGLGPEPFASLLGEMRHLDHAHRELIYLSALTVATESVTLHHEPFSAFGDKNRYAGTVPSRHYCKAVFADWMRVHRPFFDRVIASLPGTVLKGDHTFWVCFWLCSRQMTHFHHFS
jgi:hypothetical protein